MRQDDCVGRVVGTTRQHGLPFGDLHGKILRLFQRTDVRACHSASQIRKPSLSLRRTSARDAVSACGTSLRRTSTRDAVLLAALHQIQASKASQPDARFSARGLSEQKQRSVHIVFVSVRTDVN